MDPLEKETNLTVEEIEHLDEITLRETVGLMNSEDYRDRFVAEYLQTRIRYMSLHKMCIRYEAETLPFTPKCSLELLKEQKSYMGNYLRCLEVRAEIEGITLPCI